MNNKVLEGPFARQIEEFINEKRLLGYKYIENERTLYVFDQFSISSKEEESLSKKLVLDFVKMQPHWKPGTQEARISTMHQFTKYLVNNDFPAYLCDPKWFGIKRNIYKPYIFNKSEIASLFSAADKKNTHKSGIFYSTIFRLLYGCGLRISEALNLKNKDVDFDNHLLQVTNTKNKIERLIPMDISVSSYLKDFHRNSSTSSDKNSYFFKSPLSNYHYDKTTVYRRFRDLLWECNISHSGRNPGGPRLHDLRHTFCVHSLRQLIESDMNVLSVLPLLCAYIGHSSIKSTERYLNMTAEIYPEISSKMEEHLDSINKGDAK